MGYDRSKFEAFRSKVARRVLSRDLFGIGTSAEKRGDGMLRVTSGRFRPEIDGLRFFAIVPVLFGHLIQQVLRRQDVPSSSGYWELVNHLPGVLLFFAISGYILTYGIKNASRGGYGWGKYRTYVLRRFKRIAPPYYIVLIGSFVAIAVLGFAPNGARHFEASHVPLFSSLIASLFYSHWIIYSEWPRLFGLGWTLEIETQYYIIAPALTLAYVNMKNKAMKVAAGIATILLTTAIASQFEPGNFWNGTILKFFPYFFAGMLALELQDDLQGVAKVLPRPVTNLLALAAVYFWYCIPPTESGAGIGMFEYYVINILCVLMMFIAVSIEGNVLRRICVNRYVVIIGGACYSIYLTHYQVIFLLMNFGYKHLVFGETYQALIFYAATTAPMAILVGLTFYRLIERPFMMWGRTGRHAQPDRPMARQSA